MKADPLKLRIAAIFGLLAVGLGAFGAHGLEGKLTAKMLETWKTGCHYHLAHSILLLILAFALPEPGQGKWVFRSFALGVLLFSGSLYAWCLTSMHWLVFVTPLGGVFLMLGWLLLAIGRKTAG